MKADDLDSVTDPSKLSESDFAPGTKWTPAGWTRSTNAKTATKSKLTFLKNIPGKPTVEWNGGTPDWGMGVKIDFTISKSDIKKGNNIILSAIQFQNADYKNESATKNRGDDGIGYAGHGMRIGTNIGAKGTFYWTDPTGKKIKIGTVSPAIPDDHEVDFMLTITYDGDTNQFDSDLTGSININTVFGQYNQNTPISRLAPYTKDNPFRELVTTSSNQYSWTYYNDFTPSEATDLSDGAYDNSTDWFKNVLDKGVGDNSYNIDDYRTAINGNPMNVSKKQYKVFRFSGTGVDFTSFGLAMGSWMWPVDQNNRLVRNDAFYWQHPSRGFNWKSLDKNLTPKQVYEKLAETPNSIEISKQDDGSVLVGFNTDISGWYTMDSPDLQKKLADYIKQYSWTYNKASDADKQKILDNTLKFYANAKLPYKYWLYIQPAPTYTDGKRDPQYSEMTLYNIDGSPMETQDFTYLGDDNNVDISTYRHVQVKYIDKDTGRQVETDYILGSKNTSTTYDANKKKPANYIFAPGQEQNIKYTFNEDQKQNDNNPIIIYLTHGTHNTNDNSGKSTRTIQYTGLPDNLKPKDNVQTVLFKRSGVTDDVTEKTTYGDWQPQSGNGHYTAVTSPTFAGYKPDQAVVPDTAATPNKNENVIVNYSRTNQNAKLTVHDDTANTDLNDYTENSTGLYQDQINFKTAPSAVEQELKDKGYNIVSDSFKGSPTYNADDSKNNFVIHVTHKIVSVTPDQPKTPTDVIPDTKQHYPTGVDTNDLNKDVQRSIFYKYEDNSPAEPTIVQKAHFDRTVKVDAVTQKIVDNGTWATKDNYPEVATKSIDGYTPDKTKVGSATPSMTTNQDQTVVYHANDEDAAITYIDDTTGKVLKTDTQKAKYKQTIKFATDPNTQIQTYKDQGYILVSSDWKDDSTYQTDPARNKFTVHLKHGTSTVTPDNPKKSTDIIPGTKQHYPTGVDTNDLNQPQQRQITYTYADSKKQASPTVTQKATFHRTATVDNVTGKTTYTDWTTSDQYPEIKSPTIEGYTPDKHTVPTTKPELNQKQDVAVIYNPNPEQIDAIAQDNTGKQLSKSTLHGNYNTNYTATTPVIKGYHLIKMPTNTHGTYKTHNDPIIYIYAPDSNSVPEQTDGTPKPDKSSYPNDLTPAKRSTKLPETGTTNFASEINSALTKVIHNLF